MLSALNKGGASQQFPDHSQQQSYLCGVSRGLRSIQRDCFMFTFMPSGNCRRSIKYALGQPKWRGAPQGPKGNCDTCQNQHRTEPNRRIPKSHYIRFLHQFADRTWINHWSKPIRIGSPLLKCVLSDVAGRRIIIRHQKFYSWVQFR